MKNWNWYGGLFLLLIFIITGQFLSRTEVPSYVPEGLYRMMLRANHMYLLYISICNILVGRLMYHSQRIAQFSRGFLIMSGVAVSFAFLLETDGDLEHRTFSFLTAVFALVGTLLFVLDQVFVKKRILH